MVGPGGGEALTCTSCGGGGDTLRRQSNLVNNCGIRAAYGKMYPNDTPVSLAAGPT